MCYKQDLNFLQSVWTAGSSNFNKRGTDFVSEIVDCPSCWRHSPYPAN